MKNISHKLYSLAHSFIRTAALVLTGLFLLSGLLSTSYALDMGSQKVLYTWDNPLLTLIFSGLMTFVFYRIARYFSANQTKGRKILRALVLAWYVGLNLVLFVFSKTAPSGDCYSVYGIAENLALGNPSVIHPTDSYISYYPQQIGLVAFWEALMRLWNLLPLSLPAYHFIKLVNMGMGCVIILFQEQIVHMLWKDDKVSCLYLVLAGANLPLLMYASFVYGEMPSYAALCGSMYFLLKLLSQEKSSPKHADHSAVPSPTGGTATSSSDPCKHPLLYGTAGVLLLTLSIMLRKNSLIFMIAMVIVVVLCALHQKRRGLLTLAALYVVCSLSILPATERIYEHRTGNLIGSGVTATSYFAMGMQESSRARGWYNGFNFNTYQQSGMDTDAANAASRAAIAERLEYFSEHPAYAANFYLEKYLSQWADGSYACRQATLATFGGRRDFFVSLYEGEYSHSVIAYCNFYQNLLYLGSFVFCLEAIRQKNGKAASGSFCHSLPAYMGLIAVLGGFLFHMLWEANSRYILLYGFTLLPYASAGLCAFCSGAGTGLTRISRKAK